MDYRVRENQFGEWVVDVGCAHDGGVRVGHAGATMKAFIVYEMHTFDTQRKARNFIKKHQEASKKFL